MDKEMKILVVDDNRDLADNLVEILRREGYFAAAAFDGEEAISRCRTGAFDLILLDFRLPDMDGLQLQEKLSLYTDADVIIITGYGTLKSATEAVRRPRVVGFETKPLDMGRLLTFIRQVMDRRRAEKALEKSRQELKDSLQQTQRHAREVDALLEASKAVLANMDLEGASRRIFDISFGR